MNKFGLILYMSGGLLMILGGCAALEKAHDDFVNDCFNKGGAPHTFKHSRYCEMPK